MISSIQKLAYRGYRSIERKEHQLRYCFLEITRKCNLSCRHCGSDCSSDSSMDELSTEKWLSIIEEIHASYNPIFVLTGGEPLVHHDLEQITGKLHELSAKWGMVTNGMILTEDRFDKLIAHGLSAITLSVDGTEKTHRYLRKHKESWNRVIDSLNIIGTSSLNFADVVTCVWPENYNTLDQTAELLIEKGIRRWRIFRIFPKGAAANCPELILSFEQSNELIKWIAKNRETYLSRGLDMQFSCEGYLPFELDRKIRTEPYFCRAGISIGAVLADGIVTGCNNNCSDFYQGSVKNRKFSDIWENEFHEYRNDSWKQTGSCESCKEWKDCRGGSFHLREKSMENPLFCYVKPISDFHNRSMV